VATPGTSATATTITTNPVRKPRQSGHALWVGNLPATVTIHDLKDFFSAGATDDIESVFLIYRTCCAFVNYRTEAACLQAMERFHDAWFQNVRLVCRLRRGSNAATGVPAGPRGTGVVAPRGGEEEARGRDRIFIVKSLTVEDLDASVRSGVWATQSHNEAVLNDAYEV
jgi:hypothetical protein